MHKKQGLAITILRFHGAVVIASALHTEGQRFDAGWNQTVIKSVCEFSYLKAFLEDRIRHQKHKKAVKG